MARGAALLALTSAAMLAALAPTSAQTDAEGCIESSPCPWTLDILGGGGFADDEGVDESPWRSVGDWFQLDIMNFDAEAHTLVLSGATPAVRFTVPAEGATTSAAFSFQQAGTYTLTDETSGDKLDIVVVEEDATEAQELGETGSGGDGSGKTPGLAVAGVAVLLVGAAFVRRR